MSKLLDDLQGRYIGVDESPEYDQEVASTAPNKIKSCAICNKPFIKNRRAVYCSRQHYTTCVHCGKRMDIIDIYFRAGFVPKTCCKTCADIVGAQTMKDNCLEKYGVTNPMCVQEYADRAFTQANPHLDLSMRKANEIRECAVCGKEFTVLRTDPKQCCSVNCASTLRAQHVSKHVKICKLCGKPFTSEFGKSIYCSGPHYRNCVICGNPFLLDSATSLTQCCSTECRNTLIRKTNLELYGVEVGSQGTQARKKLSEAYYTSEPIRIQTCLDRYGVPNSAQSAEVRSKIAKSVKSEDCQQKIMDTCLKKYGVRHSSQSPEVHKRNWDNRKNIRGVDGTPLDSTWERTVYDFWKSFGLNVERNIPIQFEYNGKHHTTFVDFRVNGILYEVKGNHFLSGNVEESTYLPMVTKLEVYRKHNVVIIAKNCSYDIFKDGSLTGIDLALFKDLPDFPYDKQARWAVIENLVKHKKGFIRIEDLQ